MLKKILFTSLLCLLNWLLSAQDYNSYEHSIEEELKKEGIVFGLENRILVKQRGNNRLILKIDRSDEELPKFFSEEQNREQLVLILELLNNVKTTSKKVNVLETFSHSGFYLGFKNSDCDVGTYRIVLIYKQNWAEGSKLINSFEEIITHHKMEEINGSLNKLKQILSQVNKQLIEKPVEQELNAILEFICSSNGAIPYNSQKIQELNRELKNLESLIISHLSYLKIVTLK